MEFVNVLHKKLEEAAKVDNQLPMQKYMKNLFSFYGIKSPERKKVFKSFIRDLGIPEMESYQGIVLAMIQHEKREMNYCAIDLAIRCQKKYSNEKDLSYIKQMLLTRSWWDSVDGIIVNLLGVHLKKYPNQIPFMLQDFDQNGNLWLIRSSILFQLKYKKETDEELLFNRCLKYGSHSDFFIRKAIGWALREYAKTNPNSVYNFVDSAHKLSALSKKEANKHRN